jgi:hypothetical protein
MEHRSGHIALQCYGDQGEVHYADLKIRALSPARPVAAAGAVGADTKLTVANGALEPGSAMRPLHSPSVGEGPANAKIVDVSRTQNTASHLGGVRNWTNADGIRTIQAELLSGDEEVVQLRLQDGRVSSARLSLFSDKDQQFVRKMLAADKTPLADKSTSIASPLANTPAATHVLSDRFQRGVILTGRFNVRNVEVWVGRLEVVAMQGTEFGGFLHLDTVSARNGTTSVEASLKVQGKLQGSKGFEFTVVEIHKQAQHPGIVIDRSNVGMVYRGVVRNDRIIGRALATISSPAGSITFVFSHPQETVVNLPTESSATVPENFERPINQLRKRQSESAEMTREIVSQQPDVSNVNDSLERWPN